MNNLRALPFPAIAFSAVALLTACQAPPPATSAAVAPAPIDLVARGEYLVRIVGCNDCHTAGYNEQAGNVPVSEWLRGSTLGYRGPWGTTYASNLRLTLSKLDEAQWLTYSATLRTRPIMPDISLRAMSEEDRRAIYRFIRSLPVDGEPAPAYLPPTQAPPAPYFELVLPEASAKAS